MSEEVNKREFEELAADVREIKGALLGNKQFGQKGYLQRLEDIEDDVKSLQTFKKKILYYATGAAGGATGLVQIVSQILSNT